MSAQSPACPAQDGTADRLRRKRRFLEPVEHQIVRRIFGRTDLLHDDVLLALELFRIECRVRENVGQHVDRERHIRLEHACEVAGRFDARCRVEIAADGLDCFGNLARGPAFCALERHVFEKV